MTIYTKRQRHKNLREVSHAWAVVSHKSKKIAASYANKMLLDGKFKVESVNNKGNAKVGCHYFKFEEIERCYKKEYLPTIKN